MSKTLIDTHLKELIANNTIKSIDGCDLSEYVQPTSIDIPLCDKAYLVKQKFLPFSKEIKEIAKEMTLEEVDLSKGAILFKGQTYLIPCMEIDLPEELSIRVSPKSSIGRIDLLTRTIFDNSGLYDTVEAGSSGQLWIEVSPQSFNVKLSKGLSLTQLRVFTNEKSEAIDFDKEKLIFTEEGTLLPNKVFDNNKLILNLSVKSNSLVGYEAIHTNEVIDLAKIGEHEWKKFFREINLNGENAFTLEKDRFYIVITKEKIRVPGEYSMEMVPFFHLVGELRAHYAGFFDPGWGCDDGAIAVLEIRPHETLTVYDGQPICLVEYFNNKDIPKNLYGNAGNNYHLQTGPRLAKYFKMD